MTEQKGQPPHKPPQQSSQQKSPDQIHQGEHGDQQLEENEQWEHGKITKGTPVPGSEGYKGEKKLKLRAKTLINFAGVQYDSGEVFELPEREALELVGLGNAVELPDDAPGAPTKPDKK